VRAIVPNPTELMLFSVMHHCGRAMFEHAAMVTAVALAAGDVAGMHPDLRRPLARAALLHDVGELYFPQAIFTRFPAASASQVREQRSHAVMGGQVAVELARSGKLVGDLIAQSHERLDGWGYPLGLKVAELSLPAQALLFAEAMLRSIEFDANGLRRAAVAARLVPGEFPRQMVDWIVRCGNSRPAHTLAPGFTGAIALGLYQAHSVLTRTRLLLERPDSRHETTAVQLAAARWLTAVQALLDELRRTGVDSALACRMDIEPQDELEEIELGVLAQELLYRVRELCDRVVLEQAESTQLAASTLVIDLLDILRACEPASQPLGYEGSDQNALLPWSDLYCVGVRAIDDQHRILVRLLNRLYQSQRRQMADQAQAVDEALTALLEYVQSHFAFEEGLMREHDYAEQKSHADAHGRFFRRVQELLERRQQNVRLPLDELTAFLRQWLISHILRTDRELAVALNSKGVY